MFLEQQISILEWFLKDHVTYHTGVMMLKIQLYNHSNKLYLKYIQTENWIEIILQNISFIAFLI